jgi:hypothetical protein
MLPDLPADGHRPALRSFDRTKSALVALVFALSIVVPMLMGYAFIHVNNELASTQRHEGAVALCQAINKTDENIQGFVLDLSGKAPTQPTVEQTLALQAELDKRFPQYDCTVYPLRAKR